MRRIFGLSSADQQRLFGCGLTPTQLERISDEFGPLSDIGRKRLHLGIIDAVKLDWGRRVEDKKTPASDMTSHLRAIEETAYQLLSLLGVRSHPTEDRSSDPGADLLGLLGVHIACVLVEQANRNPTVVRILREVPSDGRVVGGLPPRNVDDAPIAVTGGGSLNLVKMVLACFAEGALRARAEASAAVRPGRGGARRAGRTRSSDLAINLIALYCRIRRRYPTSGPTPGYSPGGPLSRFVAAVFAAVATTDPDLKPIPDGSLGSLFYKVRKSKSAED
jgi:hypothetical protein